MAILLVLVDHTLELNFGLALDPLGAAGVEVLFALSGFPITALLLDEWATRGRINFWAFYARRARRLLPALAAVVTVLIALRPLITVVDIMPTIWPTLGYYANWASARGVDLGVLNPTWSLAVEEQFYLFWPLALIATLRWRRAPVVLSVSVIATSTALRFTITDLTRVHAGSDTQAGGFIISALLAILAHQGLRLSRLPSWTGASLGFAMFGLAFTGSPWVAAVLIPTVAPVVAAFVIWGACSRPGGPLEWSWLRYVGRRSYAMYLWHTPLGWFTQILIGSSVGGGAISVAATFVAAELSWRLVECRFLRDRPGQPGREGIHVGDADRARAA